MPTFSLTRLSSDGVGTRSQLVDEGGTLICEALELAFHEPKIAGKTRIPAGTYSLGFRAASHFDVVYRERIERAGQVYHGMIEILGVPDFIAVLFHCGNTTSDSKACVLCGTKVSLSGSGYFIPGGQSEPGFFKAYAAMSAAILNGGARLTVIDKDR